MLWSYNLSVYYKIVHSDTEIPSTDKTIIETVEKSTVQIAQNKLDEMKSISKNSSSYKMGKSNKHKQYVKRAKLKGGAKRKRSVKQEVPAMPV